MRLWHEHDDTAKYRDLLEDIDDNGDGLNSWECEFVDSMLKRLEDGGLLTESQREKIVEIHEQRVS